MINKVAIITGGAGGIGEQLCRLLHKQNVKLVIVDVNADKGEALAQDLEGSIFKKADVSCVQDWQKIIDGVDRVDYLFLNAGVLGEKGSVLEQLQRNPNLSMVMSSVQRTTEINFFQIVYGIGTILPIMEKQGKGGIAVTASTAGLSAWAKDPIYCATKHAIVGYVRSIQDQLSEMGVKSYIVCPGAVKTGFLGKDWDKLTFDMLDPAELAEAIVDLVISEKPSQTVTVMAGRDAMVQQQQEFTRYEGDGVMRNNEE